MIREQERTGKGNVPGYVTHTLLPLRGPNAIRKFVEAKGMRDNPMAHLLTGAMNIDLLSPVGGQR